MPETYRPHNHNGIDSKKIDVRDLFGPSIYRADAVSGLSALRLVQPTILQMGVYTLVDGATNLSASRFVAFPQPYSELTTLNVFVTPKSNVTHSINGIAVSGFTVSGTSATQTGNWLSLGYK